jgi:DNA-directed RNA polymerase specialized sigma24 family protein
MTVTTVAPLVVRREPPFPVPERYRRQLIDRACSGDSVAFARLYDFYAERVYAHMQFHVDNDQAAEDLTARVFLKAWRRMPCFNAAQSRRLLKK